MRAYLAIGLAILLAAAALTPMALRSLVWRWESNPILRGRLLADEAGCVGCHLPTGTDEIPNPGSRWGTVPRFGAGNGMMYDAESTAQVEEYIRFGAPRLWLDDPQVAERLSNQQVRMPAYNERFDDDEIAALVAWTAAIEGIERPSGDSGLAGRKLAQQHGCLACHGPEGSGGLPNPGGLGGFIPGFLGKNFEDLVQDEAEFNEWVRTGTSQRLATKPWVNYVWNRQALTMPAYDESLSDEDLQAIWQWIQASRE